MSGLNFSGVFPAMVITSGVIAFLIACGIAATRDWWGRW